MKKMQLFVNKIPQITKVRDFCPNVIFPIFQNMEGTQVNGDFIFRPRSLDCISFIICIINNEAGKKIIFISKECLCSDSYYIIKSFSII